MKRAWKFVVLMIAVLGLALPVTAQDLTPGTVLDISFDGTQQQRIVSFEGRAGDVFYALATTDGFFVSLELFDPSGAPLGAENASNLGTIIQPLRLPQDGRYSLRVYVSEGTQGTAQVLIEMGQPAELQEGLTMTLRGSGLLDLARFELSAGELFGFFANECAECGYWIFSPDGAEMIFDGYYSNPGVPLVYAEQGGEYLVALQAPNPDRVQPTLNRYEPEVLNSNVPVSGQIVSGEMQVFVFESAAGKAWQISAEMPEGGRALTIYRFGDRPAWESFQANDYGSGPNGNPRITPFIAPADGNYHVALDYDDWSGQQPESPFTITLSPAAILKLAPGVPISATLVPDSGTLNYLYDGTAGEKLRLSITQTSETGALSLWMLSPVDEVALFQGRAVRGLSMDLVLPADGTYRIDLNNIDYALSELSFTILLEKR